MMDLFYDIFGIYGPEFIGPTTLPYSILVALLKLSLPACILIAAVLLARLLLRKAPKWISCALWTLVALRLVCPFTIESPFSVMPKDLGSGKAVDAWMDSYVPGGYTVIYEGEPGYQEAVGSDKLPVQSKDGTNYVVTGVGVSSVPETVGRRILPQLFYAWVIGLTAMLLYAAVSYFRLKRRTAAAVPCAEGVWTCDEIDSPFILGVFRPRIYLPSRMTEPQLSRVLAHEKAHLKRHDHWWKPLGFLLLSVYWFNPLVWIAYILLCRDIEMACDERVVRDLDTAERADYAQALLDCSRSRRGIAACPLAFGEVGVKERVKGILNYKKPAFWIILIAIVACIVLATCLMTDPFSRKEKSVFDKIEESSAVKMELPDGSSFYVDSEISLLRTFADLRLVESPLEPADTEEEWLYRIIYNPDERVKGTDEIIVSFHKDYVQINSEYYLPENGVSYSSILEWASGKYEYFLRYNDTVQESDMNALRAKYPEYFDLDTFKGLEVYVWQMAPGSYSCGVMSGTNRNKTLDELMNLKGATIAEMRAILSTYDIAEENVSVIPWQNPVSSYIAEYWISQEGEDSAAAEQRKQAYVEGIRQMLFGGAQSGSLDLPNPIVEIKTTVAYANWTDDSRVFADCLNAGMMIISSVPHLPVYKLDTLKDFEQFKEKFRDILTLDHGYDEVPSFNDITALYDNSFFADHTLILAYVTAPSGSFRYAIQDISYGGSAFCLDVVQTNDPETHTDDMAGWFVIAEVLDSDIADYILFDAQLVERE